MSYINRIQNGIKSLEGGAFHKLFDEYLYKKLRLNIIQPLGVQSDTNKTTKGIPDSFVMVDDKYILICYGSVNSNPANKIKKDIIDCLDYKKTGIDASKIERIICAYLSSNLTIKQIENIKSLAKGITVDLISSSTMAHDIAIHYKSLAYDHLGIPVDSHQIFDIEDFVKVYDANGTSSPLATDFYFRGAEKERIKSAIIKNAITVVTGVAGVGKTRLVIEVAKEFENERWRILCVNSNGGLLYDDLQNAFEEEGRHIVFFDDANKVVGLENAIMYLLSSNFRKSIKIGWT